MDRAAAREEKPSLFPTLIERWIRWMEVRGSHRSISRDGTPYMERYFLLRLGPFALFLHHFIDSDLDDVHDHPWPWARLIIKGSYREHHHDGTSTVCPRWSFIFRAARELHWVELVETHPGFRNDVWTLFVHGRRVRQWGFIDAGKWAPFRYRGKSKSSSETRGWLFPRYPKEAAS